MEAQKIPAKGGADSIQLQANAFSAEDEIIYISKSPQHKDFVLVVSPGIILYLGEVDETSDISTFYGAGSRLLIDHSSNKEKWKDPRDDNRAAATSPPRTSTLKNHDYAMALQSPCSTSFTAATTTTTSSSSMTLSPASRGGGQVLVSPDASSSSSLSSPLPALLTDKTTNKTRNVCSPSLLSIPRRETTNVTPSPPQQQQQHQRITPEEGQLRAKAPVFLRNHQQRQQEASSPSPIFAAVASSSFDYSPRCTSKMKHTMPLEHDLKTAARQEERQVIEAIEIVSQRSPHRTTCVAKRPLTVPKGPTLHTSLRQKQREENDRSVSSVSARSQRVCSTKPLTVPKGPSFLDRPKPPRPQEEEPWSLARVHSSKSLTVPKGPNLRTSLREQERQQRRASSSASWSPPQVHSSKPPTVPRGPFLRTSVRSAMRLEQQRRRASALSINDDDDNHHHHRTATKVEAKIPLTIEFHNEEKKGEEMVPEEFEVMFALQPASSFVLVFD